MILVVAATARELGGLDPGVRTLVCGVGPVEAAASTAAALARARPQALLNVGLAGCRRERASLPPPSIRRRPAPRRASSA
ncbi:MAG: hypothetical protein ACXVY8_02800 [Gaiellaceae bacterium]